VWEKEIKDLTTHGPAAGAETHQEGIACVLNTRCIRALTHKAQGQQSGLYFSYPRDISSPSNNGKKCCFSHTK
jgi:hypothetical protein